jgi:hypothetical protein
MEYSEPVNTWRYVITYFSLYSINVQCEGFAILRIQ